MEMYCCVVWAVFEFTCTTHMPPSKSSNFEKWSASISCSLLFFVSADRRISWHLISTDLTDYPFVFNWHLDNVQVTHGLTGCVCAPFVPNKKMKKETKTNRRERRSEKKIGLHSPWIDFAYQLKYIKNREMYFCGAHKATAATERNETIDVLYTWNWIVNIHINSQFTCRSSPSKSFKWQTMISMVCALTLCVLVFSPHLPPLPLRKRAIVYVETHFFFLRFYHSHSVTSWLPRIS